MEGKKQDLWLMECLLICSYGLNFLPIPVFSSFSETAKWDAVSLGRHKRIMFL